MIVMLHSASVWVHTVKVVGMASFVSAQLKGSDCIGPETGTKRTHQCMVVQLQLLRGIRKKDKPQGKVRALKFLFVTSRYHEFDINRQDQ